mgnify:CR=1 FL=1
MRITRRQLRRIILNEIRIITEKRDPNAAFKALVKEMEKPGGFVEEMREQMKSFAEAGEHVDYDIEFSTTEKPIKLDGEATANPVVVEDGEITSRKARNVNEDATDYMKEKFSEYLGGLDWDDDYPELAYIDLNYTFLGPAYEAESTASF